jgi:CRP-like cAMP-binding protein
MPLDRDVETLRNIPLFKSLPTARLKLIAYTAEVMRFEPGEVIVQQGDPADAVYVIAEGEAEVWLDHGDGRRVRVNTMGPNTLFGEIAVLCRGRRTTTVRANGPVVSFKISAKLFLDLVHQSPEIGLQVMTVLAERLERTTALLQQAQRG